MAGFMDGEVGKVNEKKIGCAERGVEEEQGVEDQPGDAGGFGDGFPFAEVVRGEMFDESGHEESVAMAGCGEKDGRKRVSRGMDARGRRSRKE